MGVEGRGVVGEAKFRVWRGVEGVGGRQHLHDLKQSQSSLSADAENPGNY